MGKRRVLVIDREQSVLELFDDILSEEYQVSTAHDALEGVDSMGMAMPDVIIADLHLPVLTGVDLIKIIRRNREYDAVPILGVADHPSQLGLVNPEQVQGFLAKPFDVGELTRLVADSVSRQTPN